MVKSAYENGIYHHLAKSDDELSMMPINNNFSKNIILHYLTYPYGIHSGSYYELIMDCLIFFILMITFDKFIIHFILILVMAMITSNILMLIT